MPKILNRREIRMAGEATRRLMGAACGGTPGGVAVTSQPPELAGLLECAVEGNQLTPARV